MSETTADHRSAVAPEPRRRRGHGSGAHAETAPRQTHVTALDGLRGLAVLGVVLFHTGQLPFGWLGVPMFFALSGHFITRTLLGHQELTRAERARNFFRNRLLRLAPLYFLFVAVLTLLAAVGYGDGTITRDLPYLWTWTWNLSAMGHGFQSSPLVLYAHLWSLGVEVQLYVVWALLALFLPRRWFVRAVIALALAGPLLRWGLWLFLEATGYPVEALQPMVVYSSPVSYLDVFAIGACTALPEVRRRLTGVARAAVALFAVVTVVEVVRGFAAGGGFRRDLGYPIIFAEHYDWVWKYSVTALFFGALVHFAGREGRWQRMLSARPLARIGLISYGIYLVHVPLLGRLLEVHHTTPSGWTPADLGIAALTVVGAYLLAELSYRFVETPFLRLKKGSLAQHITAGPDRPATSVGSL
ncbi:acyltransferase family protein [Streptomyces sp. NPDC054940]